MRVLFSQTVRRYMRDPSLYTPEKTWTSEENVIADALLSQLRTNPDVSDEDLLDAVHGRRTEQYERVWTKIKTFPHIFEVLAARGEDLMRYDLHGELRASAPKASTLSHMSFRGWTVSLTDVDALLNRSALESSTWEMLAHLLRPSLPRDVLLRQVHVLRSQKTGLEHLPRHCKSPRVQIFPYLSKSKQWAMFLVTSEDKDRYTLRVLVPATYDPEAFSWATNHLRFQYRINEEPSYTQ